ncbi:hypothetical protein, partial [Roseivirga sp.]|uniref:hypothetical protein n=1 Tax=Roseivirga sp. TaxID=1964215 RepID=UPI002B274661
LCPLGLELDTASLRSFGAVPATKKRILSNWYPFLFGLNPVFGQQLSSLVRPEASGLFPLQRKKNLIRNDRVFLCPLGDKSKRDASNSRWFS